MPAPNYSGTTAASDPNIGVTNAETGILVTNFSYVHENEGIWFRDRWGGRIGRATDHDAAIRYTLEGVVSDETTGVNVAAFDAAATLANEDYFASASSTYNTIDYTTGDTMLDGASGSQPSGGAREVTLEYIRPRLYTV